MTKKQESQQAIVVTGDVTMDWNLARSRRTKESTVEWTWEDCTRATWQRGGAALLADLIAAIADPLPRENSARFAVRQTAAPLETVRPDDTRFHHSYAMWALHPYALKASNDKPAWRVESFMGLDRCTIQPQASDADTWKHVVDDTADAALVVLDDADLGFRQRSDLWPQAITTKGHRPWVILKIARPIAQGELWDHLRQNFADRLIVIMTVGDLRGTEAQISRELSWERTAQDVAWELRYNPRVNALSSCAHVVVSFYTAGAVWLSRQETGSPKSSLCFDTPVIEGMWEQAHPGGMIGYTSCLTASIARQVMLAPDKPDLERGIQLGLAAMRKLHLEGYGERGASPTETHLTFPIPLIAAELSKAAAPFSVVEVQDPVRFLHQGADTHEMPAEPGFWTILKDRYRDGLDQVAGRIVREGSEIALKDVPLGQFGNLLTVDRREIESYRSLRTLVSEYTRQDRDRPLCIAVFGEPGSGKSFGITEIANNLMPDKIQSKGLTFNLSQFNSPDELIAALHRVRDVGLDGKLPLVFWDEFDTALADKPLGWLRYFLAPMQDGKFQEGEAIHPIGKSIFVFAGGTCHKMEAFGVEMGADQFRAAKGPDFVSRLRGYVNVLGPNRQKDATGSPSAADPYFVIRRAILLRSILQRNARPLFHKQDGKDWLNIDSGVLRALLQTPEYKHGARSMEAIVSMSLLAGKTSFERSCLPSEAQLDLHVGGRHFLALVQQMVLEGELLEQVAEAAHEVFCEGLRARGYKLGAVTNDRRKIHAWLKSYAELPEEAKELNRSNVRDIPAKLASVGYVMAPARSDEAPFGFPGDDLERLSEMEHARWVDEKLRAGWHYAPKTNRTKKLHETLVPWQALTQAERAQLDPEIGAALGKGALPEKQKKKDRDLVRGIPRILAKAGYAISRAGR